MTQYSKRMVIVHWLTLILLVAAWFLGESVHDLRKSEEGRLWLAILRTHWWAVPCCC